MMPQVHATAKVMFVLGTFLPAKRASKNGSTRFFLLPSPPNMSFIVCTNASSTGGGQKREIHQDWSLSLVPCSDLVGTTAGSQGSITLWRGLTLRNVLGSVHLQRERGPAEGHSSRQQQIALNVVLVIIRLPLLCLRKNRRDKRPVRGRGLLVARPSNLHEEEEEKKKTKQRKCPEFSGLPVVPEARLLPPPQTG